MDAINVVVDNDTTRDKITDYIKYLDKARKNTGQSRMEVHQLKLTREVGIYYGLTDRDFELCEKQYMQGEDNNGSK